MSLFGELTFEIPVHELRPLVVARLEQITQSLEPRAADPKKGGAAAKEPAPVAPDSAPVAWETPSPQDLARLRMLSAALDRVPPSATIALSLDEMLFLGLV